MAYRIALLFAVVVTSTTCSQDLTSLRSFYGYGDAAAVAVSADETRAYVGEGAAITVLDLTVLSNPMPPSAVLRRILVDASIISLLLDGPDLFISGGSLGVWRWDVLAPGAVPVRFDDAGEKVCFETAVMGSYLLAAFGARNASELRIYDRATLGLVNTVPLGGGTAMALAVDGTRAYLAMGTGGLWRVDLASVLAPLIEPGPVFPVSVFNEPARARDVAIAGTRLYAAVDALGLVAIRTTLPWGPAMAYSVTSLAGPATGGGTATLYAHSVDAVGSTIAVGANRVAAAEADGGPFTSFGMMGWNLSVGDVTTPPPLAQQDALFLFQQSPTGLVLLSRTDFSGGWRSLILRPARIYAEHLALGFIVRPISSPATVLASYRGVGYAPAEVIVSLRDPNIVISGQDGAGLIWSGLLSIADPDNIVPIPGTGTLPGLGLWFDAQWLDSNPTREWFVGNGPDNWRVHRFDVANPAQGDYWELPSPDDPEPGFNNGRNYFLSTVDGDLLLLTRGGTRWGLVGYSRPAVQAAALAQPRGSTLAVPPLFQLETHFAGEASNSLTWRAKVFVLPTGQRVCAIAAGSNTSSGPDATRPQIVLYDVTMGLGATPVLLARATGLNVQGQAVGLDIREIGGVNYLFVADFGYGMLVFNVSNPAMPVQVGAWPSPPNIFDNHYDNVAEVETDFEPSSGTTWAYLAVFRRGLVQVDISNPASFALTENSVADTPGLPYGTKIRQAFGDKGLLLADHQCGLRLYGGFNRPPEALVAPPSGVYPANQPITIAFTATDPDGLQDLAGVAVFLNGSPDILPALLPYLTVTLIGSGVQASLAPLTFPPGISFQLDLLVLDTKGASATATSTLAFQ